MWVTKPWVTNVFLAFDRWRCQSHRFGPTFRVQSDSCAPLMAASRIVGQCSASNRIGIFFEQNLAKDWRYKRKRQRINCSDTKQRHERMMPLLGRFAPATSLSKQRHLKLGSPQKGEMHKNVPVRVSIEALNISKQHLFISLLSNSKKKSWKTFL